MYRVKKSDINEIKKQIPELGDRWCNLNDGGNPYLQIATAMYTNIANIHYEYIDGYIELHFENQFCSWRYAKFRRELKEMTKQKFLWYNRWGIENGACQLSDDGIGRQIQSIDDLIRGIREIIILDHILVDKEKVNFVADMISSKFDENLIFEDVFGGMDDEVLLINCGINHLFNVNLSIPDYQRDYCWEDKQITDLWNNLCEINNEYHLGTIILHKEGEIYNVIDGQQRLTTLTLILYMLGYRQLPLLNQKIVTKVSQEHVANAKQLIADLVRSVRIDIVKLKDRIIKNLVFSVLIVNSGNLDLAYTFFSNQNSRGVPLTDYDLLKAHHLRYVYKSEEAEHLSSRWNLLSQEVLNDKKILKEVLGIHLYRLRKWMRGQNWNENLSVKKEYSAALVMDGIPPFGERFDFYEKIQGGAHFFAYADKFVYQYKDFVKQKAVKKFYYYLKWGKHFYYADVIETFLFAYYLKFGRQYLVEALYCISLKMAQHRYDNNRALVQSIYEYAKNSKMVMMLDQSSSPTFFFAEVLSTIRLSGLDIEYGGVQMQFYECMRWIFFDLKDDISDRIIRDKVEYEYCLGNESI